MYSLNYHHLQYFWAIVRHGSLTKASQELRLTPQTISAQIKDLENGLGEKLFIRSGRNLVPTDVGQIVFRYAEDIFSTGREMIEVVNGAPSGNVLRLAVGISDVLPKLVVHRLLEPALMLNEDVRLVCHEGSATNLLAELIVHKLDVVLSDAPIPPGTKIKAFNHLLGGCGIVIMAHKKLAKSVKAKAPESLNMQPFLLPAQGTSMRNGLEKWFADSNIIPIVIGEFDDSALLRVFGQDGRGFFAVPVVIEDEVRRQHGVVRVCETNVTEEYYALSMDRKMKHPAVEAISKTARNVLFADNA